MTKLLWDQVGERFYEAGIDRGVLYLADGSGVAWSGLTSVEEDFGGDSTSPSYFDGVKTRDTPSIGDYSATLSALTYPPEFLEYEGSGALGNGLFVDDQPAKMFGLSYRTLVGNDVDGQDHGYKIHILYNLTATPEAVSNNTLNDSPTPTPFGWKISSIPASAPGYRPTAHVIVDSRHLSKNRLFGLEDILYGTTVENPRLPKLSELIGMMQFWNPKTIVPQSLTGLADLVDATPGTGDLTESDTSGVFIALPNIRLSETSTPGIYQLV